MRIKNLAPSNSPGRESGAVAVLFAILSLVLVICIAFAVDLGYLWQVKRSMVKATDAAALSAAQEARNAAVAAAVSGSTLPPGECPSGGAIEYEARQRLRDNRTDANLEFCVIGSAPTKAKGVVTVRGKYKARLSFAGVIGKDEITVSSSSSAKWEKAKLLPMAVCAGSSQSDISKWIADDFRTPFTTEPPIGASSSERSRLCSAGSSGGFGVIDLEPNADGEFPPDDSRTSVRDYCTRTLPEIKNTFLAALDGISNVREINKGDLRCARTGQYLDTPENKAVDNALCSARGTQFVIPIVTETPTSETGTGSDWIVRISGFALASFDAYTGNNGDDFCDRNTAAGPSRKRNLPKAQLVASRQRVRKHQRTKLRKANDCGTGGDLSITGTDWPTSIQLPASPAIVYKTNVLLKNCDTGARNTGVTLTTTIETGNTGIRAQDITAPLNCTKSGTTTIIVDCKATLNTTNSQPTATNTFAFTVAPPSTSTGTFFLTTRITADKPWNADVPEDNSFPRAGGVPGTACSTGQTDKCPVSVKPPLTTPNFRISAAWPTASFSGNEIPLTTKVDLSNYAVVGQIKLELRINPGGTGLTEASISAPEITRFGYRQPFCANQSTTTNLAIIVKTCTVYVSPGETAFEVTWKIRAPGAGTLNVSAIATPVDPPTEDTPADNVWPRTTACSGFPACKIDITYVEPDTFREMTFSFISYYGSGSSSDITSYQICRIGIKTISEATSLGC